VLESYAPLAMPVLTRRLGVWKRRKHPPAPGPGRSPCRKQVLVHFGFEKTNLAMTKTSAGGERVKTNVCTTTCRLAQAFAYILTKKLEEFVMICAINLDTPLTKSWGVMTMTPPGSPPMDLMTFLRTSLSTGSFSV